MPHPDDAHGLQIQLAAALKERDDARALAEKWARIEAAGVERGIRAGADALSEIQELQAAFANANARAACLNALREKQDAELVTLRAEMKRMAGDFRDESERRDAAESERDALRAEIADWHAVEAECGAVDCHCGCHVHAQELAALAGGGDRG